MTELATRYRIPSSETEARPFRNFRDGTRTGIFETLVHHTERIRFRGDSLQAGYGVVRVRLYQTWRSGDFAATSLVTLIKA